MSRPDLSMFPSRLSHKTVFSHSKPASVVLAVFLTISAMLVTAPQGSTATTTGCGDLQVVGLAGSGELTKANTSGTDFMGQTVTDFYDKLVASYAGTRLNISEHGVPYLDRSVPELLFTPPEGKAYTDSKNDGVTHALDYLNTVCKTVPIILAGYSQGADAVMDVYAKMGAADQGRVVAVVQFGDPRFNPNLPPMDEGTYTQRPAGHGVLNAFFGARTADAVLQAKTRSYCLYKDMMCNSQFSAVQALKCTAAMGLATKIPGGKALAKLLNVCPDVKEWIACVDNMIANKLNLPSLDCPHFDYRPTWTAEAVSFAQNLIRSKFGQLLLDRLLISPAFTTITQGNAQSYAADGLDAGGATIGDVTALTAFTIAPDGSCTGAVCTASTPGIHTVTGTIQGKSGSATLYVQPPEAPPPGPPAPSTLATVQRLATGHGTEFALKADGTVWAWGSNYGGELGTGTVYPFSATPVQVKGLSGVKKITYSINNTVSLFALKTDGTVWAWGSNDVGQLGNGTTTDSALPVQVSGLSGVQDLGTQIQTTPMIFAVKSDGTLWEWGQDSIIPQAANGPLASTVPVQLTTISGVAQVVTDGYSVMVLKADGTVWGWGQNDFGQLGDGTTTATNTPVQVKALSGVQSVTIDNLDAYAVKSDGTAWAWGSNDQGQLGNGTTTSSSTPVQVRGLSGVQLLTAQERSVMAVNGDGTLWTWGANFYGQLGNGTKTDTSVPTKVSGLTSVSSVATDGRSIFAVNGDGTEWAWGYNYWGQLGNGTTADSSTPTQVKGLSNVKSTFTDGGPVAFALLTDGTVWSWGSGQSGLLGNGATDSSFVPVRVG